MRSSFNCVERCPPLTQINVITPKSAATTVRKAYASAWKPVHYLNSVGAAVGSVLVPAGLDKSAGLIATQYLKDPTDKDMANHPAIVEWPAFMKKYYPDGSLIDANPFYAWSRCRAPAASTSCYSS